MEISDTSARERRTNGILGWRIRHLRAGKETHPRRSWREMLLRSRIHLSDSTLLKCPGPSSKMGLICPSGVRFFFFDVCLRRNLKTFLSFYSPLSDGSCVCGGFRLQSVVVRHAHVALRGRLFFLFFVCNILHIV